MGFDVALRFQAIKRGIDRPDRNLTASAHFDLLPHRDPIRSITKTQKRQDDNVFKFTEIIATCHYLYNREEILFGQVDWPACGSHLGNFKTLPIRDSRGIAGIFIGGYGAIRFGMRHPDVFGSVYAMHPVGTGTGVRFSAAIPKWDILVDAKSMDDAKKDGGTQIFTTMFQAHLPDPDKPPRFIDLLARQEGDQLIIDAKLMERFRNNLYLETMIPKYADNLKSLKGFKFDWTRNDADFDHVYANQAFTYKLNEFGIIYEAEEYNGAFGADWGVDGRIYTDALPFFQRHLVFDSNEKISHR